MWLTIINTTHCFVQSNDACVEQVSKGFSKGDRIKHIAPKFFFTHEQQGDTIQVQSIAEKDNHADMFTKALPPALHQIHCEGIGLKRLSRLMKQTSL
jgi:hypothetical protein